MICDEFKPFVGVWIAGGVGNQLFQYAAAYAYSLRTGATLLLDTNFFEHPDKDRDYALSRLGIDAEKWTWGTPVTDWSFSISPWRWASRLRKLMIKRVPHCRIVTEQRYDYNDTLLQTVPPIYLYGYWQSPLYFEDAAICLRAAINLAPLIKTDILLEKIIKTKESVAIHIRHGDYALYHRDTFGLIPYEYYAYAATLLRKSLRNPHFFVFSDDYGGAREMLGDWPDVTICPTTTQEKDLALIAACKHQVIANSTFSWWGAWLNPNPEKIVIAPKQWTTKKILLTRYIFDLFPKRWLLL